MIIKDDEERQMEASQRENERALSCEMSRERETDREINQRTGESC